MNAGLRVPYKVYPLEKPNPAFPGVTETWLPVVNVCLIINHQPTKRFEAIVDSGAASCLFHADIAKAMGLKVDSVQPEPLGGVVGGALGSVFYHEIKLSLPGGGSPVKVTAGFSPNLSIVALLGRHGFFEHFTIKFDSSAIPPSIELERFHRT